MKTLKILLVTFLVIAVIIGGSFLIILNLARRDPNAGKYQAQPSTDLIDKSINSAIANQEIELSEQDINGFLAYCINEDVLKARNSSDLAIKNVNIDIKNDDSALFYVSYDYKGTEYGLSSEVDLTFDPNTQQFVASIDSLKIGQLKVPVNLALSLINDKLPYGIDTKDNTIYLDYNKIASLNKKNQDLSKIESFHIDGEKAYIKLPKASDTAGNYVKDAIEKGIAQSGEYINNIINNITDFFMTK